MFQKVIKTVCGDLTIFLLVLEVCFVLINMDEPSQKRARIEPEAELKASSILLSF